MLLDTQINKTDLSFKLESKQVNSPLQSDIINAVSWNPSRGISAKMFPENLALDRQVHQLVLSVRYKSTLLDGMLPVAYRVTTNAGLALGPVV